ncbi:MAG: alpha/beta hydrolase [Gammaproteobacteria bacterium]|nr:MAG: alpha/beta hydrolase [Gammaproteobacteria bacterium]UCH40095.1 MAG: alpha/beta hydrolase [Gammaproteobacteria bacterium]
MNGIWKFLAFGACIYLALVAFVYFFQSRLIYYPNMPGRSLVATPQIIGLEFEDVQLVTKDGIKLHGWFIPARQARGTVLFFHGNAGNISHRLDSIDIFNRLGLNVFILDYRGYGHSEGRVTEAGTYRDAEAGWNYLIQTRGLKPARIIVFGRSLGASIAAWLASKHEPAALILESSFSSVVSMAKRIYPIFPVRWLTYFKYDTRRYVANTTCPVLVVHSKNDEIIPYAEGREVFEAAPGARQFLQIRGGHNDGFLVSGPSYVEGLATFIAGNLK